MRRIPTNTVERMWSIAPGKSSTWLRISSRRRLGHDRSRLSGSMKKIAFIAVTGLAVMAIAGIIVFRTIAGMEAPKLIREVSQKAAQSLQEKIDAIKKAGDAPDHKRGSSRV